jgi:hypothetical protein
MQNNQQKAEIMKLIELGYVELETLKALVKGETTFSHYVTNVTGGEKYNTLFLAFVNGKIQNVSGLIAKVTGNKLNKDRELVINAGGMDPIYSIMDEFNSMLPAYVEHFKLDVTLPTRCKFSSDGIY